MISKNYTVPFNRCYWVVPGKLMAGCYPGALDKFETHQKLKRLLDHGIRHVVNLMEPDEHDHSCDFFEPYEPVMKSIAEESAIDVSFNRFSIPDLSIPSVQKMVEILDHIDQKIIDRKPVYVHCRGGIGRTGTGGRVFLGKAWLLIRKKRSPDDPEARRKVVDFRRSPETAQQMDMVVSWVKGQ